MKKKNIISIAIVIAFLFLTGWVVTLFGTAGVQHEYYILLDLTEEDMQHPSVDILRTNFEQYPTEDGIIIHFIPITEIKLNPIITIVLPTVSNSFLSNEVERREQKESFFNEVDEVLKNQLQQRVSRDGSVIYPLLVSILKDTTRKQQYASQTILLYSDLMEYSTLADFYRVRQIDAKIITHWENLFNEAFSIPQLKNIDLYIIHHPQTKTEGVEFDELTTMYKALLSPYGLNVYVSANTPSTLVQRESYQNFGGISGSTEARHQQDEI